MRRRLTSAIVSVEFGGMADLENVQITVGILLLAVAEGEIEVIRIWHPPFCATGVNGY